ncbi:MAG TPA: VWA domain-containing protein [Bryobacteraceae bacterium]|nr:VWA domain-containing protein [Bryobacteraceae bacterium]
MYLRSMLFLAAAILFAGGAARAQEANPQSSGSLPVIKTETRLVLVDAVVTDKKGEYVHDLEQKDFKVWEDNKEQTVTSFSFEASPNSPNNTQKHYLVLLFDNATMDLSDQARARQAAAQFIDANAGPNRAMAILNYAGGITVAQNFTTDADRLKKVVAGVQFSPVSPNQPVEVASTAIPNLGRAEASFGLYDELLALRSMAKLLAPIPGRKMVIFLTSGFVVPPENMSELTAVISECNHANVAIYPIDVRGLVAGATLWHPASPQLVQLVPAGYSVTNALALAFFQHGGGGGGGGVGGGGGGTGGGRGGGGTGGGTGVGTGGGTGGGKGGGGTGGGGKGGGGTGGTGGKGGGTGGTTGGGGGSALNPFTLNPYNQSRMLIPHFPTSAATNQQVLYSLAAGTGGFVIANTNDLLGGFQKIAQEQDQFYLLGYTPAESEEGSCHFLKVKVERPGVSVRFRNGYCNVKSTDALAGNPVEKTLENQVAGTAPGVPGASIEAPFFYTSPNTARVDVALEIPPAVIKFEKAHGKLRADLNILAIAYRGDGSVAARFSDTKTIEVENKKEAKAFAQQPYHYDGQFDMASGQYTLKAAFGAGNDFSKVQMPLTIEPYDTKQFGLSSLALSKDLHRVADVASDLDAVLLEGRTPLIAQGYQITPAGSYKFKTSDNTVVYAEIYEPHIGDKTPPIVGVQIRVLDRKTNDAKEDSGLMSLSREMKRGNPVIPVGFKISVGKLNPGSYRAEVTARDTLGNTKVRVTDFDVE